MFIQPLHYGLELNKPQQLFLKARDESTTTIYGDLLVNDDVEKNVFAQQGRRHLYSSSADSCIFFISETTVCNILFTKRTSQIDVIGSSRALLKSTQRGTF